MSDLPVQDQKEFDNALKVISWNRWLLAPLGIWPIAPSEFRFVVNFGYFVYLMAMEYLDLCLAFGNLEQVIENLSENIAVTQIFVQFAMLRCYIRPLGTVLGEVLKDYDAKKYRNQEESQDFMRYNKKAKLFIKMVSTFVFLTGSSYFTKPLSSKPPKDSIEATLKENETAQFTLPYRFHVLYPINDSQTYMLTYLSQLPFLLLATCSQTAADGLMVTLVFHVCGQMSILAKRISAINTDPDFCDEDLHRIIQDHNRLLYMGNIIQEAFSEMLLVHLIGATFLVCIVGYQVLLSLAREQNADLMTFVFFISLVLLVLYAQCTVGESLITESYNVSNAFYDCKWYDMPTNRARIIIICMARSQKPLCLTAGKFGIFCLSTLTESVKTAMGYLSVLRTLL